MTVPQLALIIATPSEQSALRPTKSHNVHVSGGYHSHRRDVEVSVVNHEELAPITVVAESKLAMPSVATSPHLSGCIHEYSEVEPTRNHEGGTPSKVPRQQLIRHIPRCFSTRRDISAQLAKHSRASGVHKATSTHTRTMAVACRRHYNLVPGKRHTTADQNGMRLFGKIAESQLSRVILSKTIHVAILCDHE